MYRWTFFISILFMTTLYSCAFLNNVPPELESATVSGLTLETVRENPAEYKGQTVMWGGKVAQTLVKEEGALVEIVQFPLDNQLKPRDVDISEGRFLVLKDQYLDPMIFRSGRKVTVVGEIRGSRTMKLDEITYTYPLVKAETLHLWEEDLPETRVYYSYPPYPYWYGRHWGWYP